MTEPAPDRDPLEFLAEEFLERQRKGQYPSISEYVEKYPELAEEIQDLFPTIASLERWKVYRDESGSGGSAFGNLKLERLGDFRILGEIGRGGMGIVYEAFQESLGRHVAVKVLPKQALLEPKHLERFKHEARTAARLHHTNIVPLFGMGQQDGLHYIVMQLIRGVGLDAVLARLRSRGETAEPASSDPDAGQRRAASPYSREAVRLARSMVRGELGKTQPEETAWSQGTGEEESGASRAASDPSDGSATPVRMRLETGELGPAYWRSVATIGMQVADALEYAHGQRTLHRDIKPANLLLDRQGVVWITDFGLAKAMDSGAESQTTGVAGTLRYMAPEQFSGRLDARSDIYSLGLTLYELVTLEPAFVDTSSSNLIRRITHDAPVPPRRMNPRIPRDLETIVLKAIARDPQDRYRTAGALASDLQCFVEDRPIEARRASGLERLWRWSRRNRALAALTASTATLLLAVAIVASVAYVRTNQANIEEARQRKRAEGTSALALEALDNIFQQFAPDRTAPASSVRVIGDAGEEVTVPIQPVLSKEAAALLEKMLAFYDRLAAQGGDDVQLRRKVAEANRRVGDIRQRLGQYQESKAAYTRAIELYSHLNESAGEINAAMEIARIHNELGSVESATEGPKSGEAEHLAAVETLKGVPLTVASSARAQYELARSYYFLGRRPGGPADIPPPLAGRHLGPRPEPGGFSFDPRGPRRPHHGPPEGGPDRHGPHERPGWREPGPGPREERPDDHELGLGPGKGPPDGHEFGLGPGKGDFGPPPGRGQRPGGPPGGMRGEGPPDGMLEIAAHEQAMGKAIGILEKLVAEYPGVPDYQHLLARCYREVPPRGLDNGSVSMASAADKATRILERLVERHPDVPDYRYDLCETYAMLGAWGPPGAPPLAKVVSQGSQEKLEKALGISEELVAEHPNIPDYMASQVHLRMRLADHFWQSDPPKAEEGLRKAIEVQSTLVRRYPQNSSYKFLMVVLHESLAWLLEERGQLAEARTTLESCVASLDDVVKSDPKGANLRWVVGHSYQNLADLLRQMGDKEGAEAAERHARDLRPER